MSAKTQRPMPPVVVIDSIMGSGKTTYIIDHMNRTYWDGGIEKTERYLYVTPLLAEVKRVEMACPVLQFKDPVPILGRKYQELDRLIDAGENIATTHALFKLITSETLGKLKAKGYTLIIDEVLTCVDHLDETTLSRADQVACFRAGMISVDDADLLRWHHDRYPNYRGKHEVVRNLCDNGNLIAWSMGAEGFVPGKKGSILLWAFPTDFLAAFKKVYLLTYLFHGSPMRAYLEAEGVRFDLRTVTDKGHKLVPWFSGAEKDAKARIREYLKVYEGPLNAIGTRLRSRGSHPLGKTWFNTASTETLQRLRAVTTNYFRKFEGTSDLFAWTTFKGYRKAIKGKGYKRPSQWIALNAKATNDYRGKTVLAYLANRFSLPGIRGYFQSRGVAVYDDLYATSEMIQWLWRSAIRDPANPQEVNVFIPSERMRGLLKTWLACDDVPAFIKRVTRAEGFEHLQVTAEVMAI